MQNHNLFVLAAFVANLAAQSTPAPCPSLGIVFDVVAPLKLCDITVAELECEGIESKPSSQGRAASPAGHTGGYSDQFQASGTMTWIVSHPLADEVLGMASVQGFVSADILAGDGNASAYAGAKSKVVYSGKMALAEDHATVAIASHAAPIGVGGEVTIFGIGGGFQFTVTPDLPGSTKAVLLAVDTEGWTKGNAATATLNNKTYGNVNLIPSAQSANCAGEISGEAKSGALVLFRQAPKPGASGDVILPQTVGGGIHVSTY